MQRPSRERLARAERQLRVITVFAFLLFFLFLFFGLRGLFWRGRRGGGWGYRHGGIPPAFEEWHRRAHEQQAPVSTPPAPSTTA